MKILLIDDDIVDRKDIKRLLANSAIPCQIDECDSVDQGLKQLRASNFDIVLLDYMLPGRNGIELLKELHNEDLVGAEESAIIMISNSNDEQLALDCLSAGAQDFIVKSQITVSRLWRAIIHSRARYELEQKLYTSYKEVKALAELDSLTGLANRYRFEEGLRSAVADNLRNGSRVALMVFDLDHFKFINDNHGHDVGDILLKKIAESVKPCLRNNELFARMGGDEFAIILEDIKNPQFASGVAKRVLDAIDNEFDIGSLTLKTSASIGLAFHPDSCDNGTDLMKFADIALYRAKQAGRNQICFFEQSMQEQFLKRHHIETQLRFALLKKQFELHYQPLYEPNEKSIVGFEALLRCDFNGTKYTPDEFIPVAEESRLIIDIGWWIIEQAIKQLSEWSKDDKPQLMMGINLSAIQLAHPDLVSFIENCCHQYQVLPSQVEFELTETALFADVTNKKETINSISQLGCKIALDDFGTGYSSVSHLQEFPIDSVKLDKSLMVTDSNDRNQRLTVGLTKMLHALNLDVVGEGIETEENLQLCCELKIERVQGYLLARPLPVSEVDNQIVKKMH